MIRPLSITLSVVAALSTTAVAGTSKNPAPAPAPEPTAETPSVFGTTWFDETESQKG